MELTTQNIQDLQAFQRFNSEHIDQIRYQNFGHQDLKALIQDVEDYGQTSSDILNRAIRLMDRELNKMDLSDERTTNLDISVLSILSAVNELMRTLLEKGSTDIRLGGTSSDRTSEYSTDLKIIYRQILKTDAHDLDLTNVCQQLRSLEHGGTFLQLINDEIFRDISRITDHLTDEEAIKANVLQSLKSTWEDIDQGQREGRRQRNKKD